MVSRKYRDVPVLNLGCVPSDSIYEGRHWLLSGVIVRPPFFRQVPIARIFIFIEAGISSG